MKKFTVLLLVFAVLAASMVSSAYATERYEHQQTHFAQAAHTHCATQSSHTRKDGVNLAHADEHSQSSTKQASKSLCGIACHAPLMLYINASINSLKASPMTIAPLIVMAEVLPSWLSGVPDQPPKHS